MKNAYCPHDAGHGSFRNSAMEPGVGISLSRMMGFPNFSRPTPRNRPKTTVHTVQYRWSFAVSGWVTV
jgi:hypothetical protein